MKKTIVIISVLLLVSLNVFSQSRPQASKAPFSRGVNFGDLFELINGAQEISFRRYTEQDFADVKRLGVDVIRLPIDLNVLTSTAPNYILDPLFLTLLDKVVDLAEKYQIYIILDYHTSGQPAIDNSIRNFLLPVWTQIAQHFKDRSQYVIYEIINEPNGISNNDWGRIQGDVIDAIRKIDKDHWIIVTGTEWSSIKTLSSLPRYSDNKLLYTFHFYSPPIFTHQGTFGSQYDSTYRYLAELPFPYDRNRMPPIPDEVKRSWIKGSIENYPNEATTAALTRLIDQAANFAKQRNVPVFCGEFGVFMKNALPDDRLRWYRFVREAFEARNIPWTMWDYFKGWGIFLHNKDCHDNDSFWGDINTDLNVELAQALGFNTIPQQKKEPLRSGFTIYDDYTGRGILFQNWGHEKSDVNLFYTSSESEGYAIQWKDINRMDITFPINDFSYLVQNGFVLEFKAKAEKQIVFDISFGQLQDNILWGNGIKQEITPDGKWHTYRIPLKNFTLWDGWDPVKLQSVETKGRVISWNNATKLGFNKVSSVGVSEIYFDDIKITR